MTVEAIEASLVRRLDYRFLLPTPSTCNFRRMVLLGGDRRLADAAVAIGLAGEVTTTLERGSAADLIAVLPGAEFAAGDLARAAAPGGVIYIEVDRRRRGSRLLTPHRLADRLTARGASVVAQYALGPRPEACELFVPIDDSPALGWFLSSVYVASSAAKVISEAALRTLLGSNGRRVGRIAPFHATVAVLPPVSGTPLSSRRANGASELREMASTAMIIHGGNRVVLFAFSAGTGATPLSVAKIPTQQKFNERTRHEHVVLSQVRAALGPAEADSVPEPHALVELGGGGLVAIESAASGASLARSSGRWGRPLATKVEDLSLATDWLIRLHRDHAIRPGSWDDSRQAEAVERPLAGFASRFGVADEEAQLFDCTRAAARELSGASVPVVWEHADFSIWNVFRDDDRLRVLDWESARPGVPLKDMIRLVTHWHESVRRLASPTERQSGLTDLFCSSTAGSAATTAARRAVERYEQALGLDPRFRSVLLVMSRVELAARRHDQQQLEGTATGDARAGNAALRYLSSLVGQETALFGAVRVARMRS